MKRQTEKPSIADQEAKKAVKAARKALIREGKSLPPKTEKKRAKIKPKGKRGNRLNAGDVAAAKLCKELANGECELAGWKFDCLWNGGYTEAHHLRSRPRCSNEERHSQDMLTSLCVAHHNYADMNRKEVAAEIRRRRAL